MENENQVMVEMFVHESLTLIEQLETKMIESERAGSLDEVMDEIFRVMHTVKGNAMMMQYDGIANAAHALEDLFDYIRTENPKLIDFQSIANLVLETVDYIKHEIEKLSRGEDLGVNNVLKEKIVDQLDSLKFMNENPMSKEEIIIEKEKVEEGKKPDDKSLINNDSLLYFNAFIKFDERADMVNIRAFSIINQLNQYITEIITKPDNLEDENSGDLIIENGFTLYFSSTYQAEDFAHVFNQIPFVEEVSGDEISRAEFVAAKKGETQEEEKNLEEIKEESIQELNQVSKENQNTSSGRVEQNYISVKVNKLDALMNLVSELVVSEAMVTRNPELEDLELDDFHKAAKHMKKIMNDLQDVVMEIRMVPLALTFLKMNRLVRDMSLKTNKKVELTLIGQDTEVDKSIIEHISDPLMHLFRNAIDHGIELPQDRIEKGKSETGEVVLEAKRVGGEIHIIVKDDGKGLDRHRILEKAKQKNMLFKEEDDYSNEEVFDLIFEAGFSTNDEATSFSGRGVGMDVVAKGIEKIGGKIQIHSEVDVGTEVVIRIPLTLAIVDCILSVVGNTKYAIPITSVKQLLKVEEKDIIKDMYGNEMLLYGDRVLEIKKTYRGTVKDASNVVDGILVLIENDDKAICYLVDDILGEYQLVVKNFPKFIDDIVGISGCALLGNGDISLIVDPSGLFR